VFYIGTLPTSSPKGESFSPDISWRIPLSKDSSLGMDFKKGNKSTESGENGYILSVQFGTFLS